MKKTLSMIMTAAVTVLMSCCTSEELFLADGTDGATDGTSVISFTASVGSTTRADDSDELQSSDEKSVTSLYAVLFSTSATVTSGDTNKETGTETFYKVYQVEDITESNPLSSDATYTISIDEEEDGDDSSSYQLCFVANPPSDLFDELTTTSTVSNFKDLVVSQEPDATPMLMVSECFYAVSGNTTISSVALKRIMARIDIINLGDGLIITKAVMKNRAVKSTLINDSNTTQNTDYLETTDKEYDFSSLTSGGLEGSSEQTDGVSESEASDSDVINASKSEIYSYEQFGTDSYLPVITLTYKFSSDATEQTVNVEFVTTDTDGNESPLYIQRNNYYRIKVNVSEAETPTIAYELSVADWSEGETFAVASSTLTDVSDPYNEAEVGDLIMSDGSLLKVTTTDGNTTLAKVDGTSVTDSDFSDNYYPIAVVFYVVDDDDDSDDSDTEEGTTNSGAKSLTRSMSASDRFGITAYKALGGAVHGKALALKNAASQSNWAEGTYATSATEVLDLCPNIEETYADYDGYGNCQAILALATESNTFPDFTNAQSNNSVSAPNNTTGWYLPAMGEWYDIIEGLTTIDLSSYQTSEGATNNTNYDSVSIKYWPITGAGSTAVSDFNTAMSVAGSSYYDAIESGCFYTTSTETSANTCRNVGFKTNLVLDAYKKKSDDNGQRVRSVLAF